MILTVFFRAVIEYRVHKRVQEQFEAFMAGFSELIPQDLINVFDERELEVGTYLFAGRQLLTRFQLLIGGMSESMPVSFCISCQAYLLL